MPVTDAPGKVAEVVDFGQLIGFEDYVVIAVAVEFGETRMLQGFLWRSLERRPSKIAASSPPSLNYSIAANTCSIFAEVVYVARTKLIQLNLQSDYEE